MARPPANRLARAAAEEQRGRWLSGSRSGSRRRRRSTGTFRRALALDMSASRMTFVYTWHATQEHRWSSEGTLNALVIVMITAVFSYVYLFLLLCSSALGVL